MLRAFKQRDTEQEDSRPTSEGSVGEARRNRKQDERGVKDKRTAHKESINVTDRAEMHVREAAGRKRSANDARGNGKGNGRNGNIRRRAHDAS